MGCTGDAEPLSFVERELPPNLVASDVTLAVGGERSYVRGEWAGAIIVVKQGALELECRSGACARFETGAVLFLDSPSLRTLRSVGAEPVHLVAVARRARRGPAPL
jgi:hypothetical protein